MPADRRGPIIHQLPPPLEQVRPRVGGLDLVGNHVRQRRLDDLARMIGLFGSPVPKGGTETVRHGRDFQLPE